MEWSGISEVEGASTSKTRSFCHFCWYFFSMAIRESRFSVCGMCEHGWPSLLAYFKAKAMTYSLQLLRFGDGKALQGLGRCGCGSHVVLSAFEQELSL